MQPVKAAHCALSVYGLTYAPPLPPEIKATALVTPPRPVGFRVAYGKEIYLHPGDPFTFGFVVVGKALQQLPYLLAALREVGQQGLGYTRGRMDLQQVVSVQPYSDEARMLLSGENLSVNLSPFVVQATELPPIQATKIRLHLRSPLHIKEGGVMAQDIQFPLLIRALQRRVSNLEQVHGGNLVWGLITALCQH